MCLCILLLLLSPASAQTAPVDVTGLQIPSESNSMPPDAVPALLRTGVTEVIVGLADAPLAAANGPNSKHQGSRLNGDQQRAYLRGLGQKQDAVITQIQGLGGVELARVGKAHNALVVRAPVNNLPAIRALPGVVSVRKVRDYSLSLSTTVPYIGAAAAQAAGITGAGVTIAILDSGIDYTHRNLGGPGTPAAYIAAYGTSSSDPRNKTLDGLFPTAKVVGGFDFVGERWPNAALAPDPDPIDFDGHGTHVADIAAGHSTDGLHKGVAPDAKLLAVKVCSSVSPSCSGIALLEGLDFALDPNDDGDLSDAVDVINLSLGASYGQQEDDLSEACHDVSLLGVVVVAAAGNDGDKPYVVSSPSSTREVISVAETQVPAATAIPLIINSPAVIAGTDGNTATLSWAPVIGVTTGNVAYVGRGCPGDAYLANPAGKVALIDRGACNVSLKVDRAVAAGAIGVLIGLVAPGDATSFSFGGGTHFAPSLVITQATSNRIKANLAAPVNVTISAAAAIPLVGSMVSSSARGPSYSDSSVQAAFKDNTIKPDIGAPGASVSAQVGTGTGETAFGGTSGATPMISGSAALLLQAFPQSSPAEIKARLMNNAAINILINPATQPGATAPITRIGAGEVRVNTARFATTVAWDADNPGAASLSFGFARNTNLNNLPENKKMEKTVALRNDSNHNRVYQLSMNFRDPADAASGAVGFSLPNSMAGPPGKVMQFKINARVEPDRLPLWTLNGGSKGGTGSLLQTVEFDGYLSISDGSETIRLPWHILPHRAANVEAGTTSLSLNGSPRSLTLSNKGGSVPGGVDVFALTGVSPQLPPSTLPSPGDNFAVIDLKSVGVRLATSGLGPAVQFAINTWEERAHPNYPAEFDIYVDSNNDGVADFVVFNLENGGFAATGQNVTAVFNLRTNTVTIPFFTDADLDSANAILTAPLSALGLTPSTQFTFQVIAGDNYFTGAITDSIGPMKFQLDAPRFTASAVAAGGVPVDGSVAVTVSAVPGGDVKSPSQSGLLLMYRDARAGREAEEITVIP